MENVKSLFATYETKLCCSHKGFKTSIKSWINTKKSTQGNSIKSKSMVETIY